MTCASRRTQRLHPCKKEAKAAAQVAVLAGNEHHMPANLAHCEDLSQLEDDIVSFLPTVSDIEVFGCEIDLIEPDTQLPLRDPFRSTLLQRNRLQVIVRPCSQYV